MADVTFTLTVPGGAAGGFYIDGVQRDTLSLDIGKTYRFDDSDPSCSGNNLVFSTTPDGIHNGGIYYNTGTTRFNSPGQPGAYVEITITASTPSTLYYFSIQNSGMGGLMNIDLVANSWGSQSWGEYWWNLNQDLNTGWNTKTWGASNWGDLSGEVVQPTGLSITSTLNDSVTVTGSAVVDLVGVETTSNVGSLTITANADVLPSGVSFTGNVGSLTTEIGVSVELLSQEIASALGVITPADQVMGLTGLEFNVEQGTAVAPNEDVSLTGVEFTSALGTPTIDVITVVEPTGLEITSEQGTAIAPNNAVTLQGQESEFSLGQLVGLGSSVVNLEGQSVTSTVGSIDPADQVMGLTGVSFSSSVGSISVEDQVVGLQGFEITASVGAPFIIHYQDVDTGSNTNYSGVSTGSNTSYSNVATGSNTSYSDAA